MKLFYLPGACSLASHIVLREVTLDFELDRVDMTTQTTEAGADYSQITPKGYVPALQLDDGQVLTEGVAILQYLADCHPDARLVPPPGTLERARLQEHLNFIATELHKAFMPFFSDTATDADKAAAASRVGEKLSFVEAILSDGRTYLMGDAFSVADAYLFTVANWTAHCGIDLSSWPSITALSKRVGARESVRTALKAEGLTE